ncbi:MAG: sigma-54-dependent Fis family transcriptional regulator, partial [Deltaproteobacteria bacterium]
ALEGTGARYGAIFLWDDEAGGLAIHFHYVNGVIVKLPGVVLRKRRDDRPNGIALWVAEHNESYLCNDTSADPNYAPYFEEVGSVVAVPIPYQERAIGVISVSAKRKNAFTEEHVQLLEQLASSAAKHLRRAQLYWSGQKHAGRPLLIKGLSPEWLEVERQVEMVAGTDAPVLIQGESGTGKELVANAIHFNSKRSGRKMVVVNCAAIPDTLLESMLFGHVKGAFTGAASAQQGEFKRADGSTLFLDEIGDMPLPLQAKVLRAVEDGEIKPLGSTGEPTRVDVRLICATNRDLATMVMQGRFRDDLYYRLGVVTIELPPLRRYIDNLPVLAEAFVLQAARRHDRPARRISKETLELLRNYRFPGNVRELKNAMEYAVIMCPGEEIGPQHLPRSIRRLRGSEGERGRDIVEPNGGEMTAARTLYQFRKQVLEPLERRYLVQLLEACHGAVSKAAARAGVNPATFYRLLRKYGISLRRF